MTERVNADTVPWTPADPALLVEDAIVRIGRELRDDETWVSRGHGERLTVSELVQPRPPEEREDDEITVPFIEGSDDHGCTVIVPADAVEVVMTAAQADARKYPTGKQLAQEIASELCGMDGETFELDETDSGGDEPTFEAYGRTHEGLTFGIRVRIEALWATDS